MQLAHNERSDLLSVLQIAINSSPSPQRVEVPRIKAIVATSSNPPSLTFYCSTTAEQVSVADLSQMQSINCSSLSDLDRRMQSLVPDALQENQRRGRKSVSKEKLPNVSEGDFVLVAKDEPNKG